MPGRARGSHALYTADQDEDERFELFSIATDNSAPPRKLNGPLVSGGDVGPLGDFELSFDGRWIVYTADQETNGYLELFGVPADGSSAAVKLSASSDRLMSSAISYDSAWVVYLSDPSGTNSFEVLSVPIDGSAPAHSLGGSMVPGDFDLFPQVAYRGDLEVHGAIELYAASTPTPRPAFAPRPTANAAGSGHDLPQ